MAMRTPQHLGSSFRKRVSGIKMDIAVSIVGTLHSDLSQYIQGLQKKLCAKKNYTYFSDNISFFF